MLDEDGHGCGSIGRWLAVLCAAAGVGIAFLMLRAMGVPKFVVPLNPPPKEIIIGLIALFVAAALLGKKAGMYLCGKSHNWALNIVVGIGVAFGSIAIAVVTGTFVGFIGEAPQILSSPDFHPLNVLMGFLILLGIVLFFGGIPAAFLGVFYGLLVRNRLRKLNL